MGYAQRGFNYDLERRREKKLSDIRCPQMKEYYKMELWQKKSFLVGHERKNISYLFRRLKDGGRGDIVEKVRMAFLNGVPRPVDDWQEVKNYFYENSWFVRKLIENPGSPEALDFVYSRIDKEGILGGYIDQYFYSSLSIKALTNRLETVINYSQQYLLKKIRSEGFSQHRKLALDLGSGYGDTAFGVMKNKEIKDNCEFHCIDILRDAILRGKERALLEKLVHVKFFRGNIMNLKYKSEADYEVLVGISCGLNNFTNIDIFEKIKEYLKPGSQLIVACLTDEMLRVNYFLAWLLYEMTGWELFFRKRGELKDLFESANIKWIGSFPESKFSNGHTQMYEIGIGEV